MRGAMMVESILILLLIIITLLVFGILKKINQTIRNRVNNIQEKHG